jgi:hypothetical protein
LEERTIFFFPSSGPFKLSKPGPVLLSGKALNAVHRRDEETKP